jgi:RNA polymerase sigma-70 factor (ECF subfamily)
VGNAALVEGLRAGNAAAAAELHRQYAAPVLRVLMGILGPDRELADLHHDVFVRALESIGRLHDPDAIGGWMRSVAVHTARASIERRISRRRWLSFLAPDDLPEASLAVAPAPSEAREALRATYDVLERLPTDERIAFALRHLDGLELSEVAQACAVSLASIKRRLVRAEERFAALARRVPCLVDYLSQGARWTRR